MLVCVRCECVRIGVPMALVLPAVTRSSIALQVDVKLFDSGTSTNGCLWYQ